MVKGLTDGNININVDKFIRENTGRRQLSYRGEGPTAAAAAASVAVLSQSRTHTCYTPARLFLGTEKQLGRRASLDAPLFMPSSERGCVYLVFCLWHGVFLFGQTTLKAANSTSLWV